MTGIEKYYQSMISDGTSLRREIVPYTPHEDPLMELSESEEKGKTVSLIETVYRKTVLYPMLSMSIYNYLFRRGMMKNGKVFGALTSFESSINGKGHRGYQ